MRRRSTSVVADREALPALERLWTVRILIPLGGLKRLVSDSIGNHKAFMALGIGDPALDELTDPERYKFLQPRASRAWQEVEAMAAKAQAPDVLRDNLARLSQAFGFDPTDIRLLEWACLISTSTVLAGVTAALGSFSAQAAVDALAKILGLPRSKVQKAIARGSALTQSGLLCLEMESFAGVFVTTTNLLDVLDPASPRRFDLKVRFGHLRPEQAAELLRRHCRALRLEAPRDAEIARISQLATLTTAGDFATVVRQHAFHPFVTAGTMLDALAAQCSLKSGGRQAIGFAAH